MRVIVVPLTSDTVVLGGIPSPVTSISTIIPVASATVIVVLAKAPVAVVVTCDPSGT